MHDARAVTLAVIRHPYERAVSQWRWGRHFTATEAWVKDLGYADSARGMNAFIADVVANATRAQPLPVKAGKLAPAGRRPLGWRPGLPRTGRHVQDCHWVPQAAYVFERSGRRVVDE